MDADAYPQEVLAEEEPRYLRRQKPLEIKRRKFGKKAWKTYLQAAAITGVSLAGAAMLYGFGRFLLYSPDLALVRPDQVALTGNHYISRAAALEIFSVDRGRSVLSIPLDERRHQFESLPWVERAAVRRVLPNRIQVELVERVPVAFLRQGSEMALVDVHGVILDRPLEGDFHFPVVTGIHSGMPLAERERRMQLYSGFLQQIDAARPRASDLVSEVDLADASDLKATLSGLPPAAGKTSSSPNASPWGQSDGPLVVHFGDRDFESRYQTLLDNIGQWRATAGRVESVDLRFNREVVVNPEERPANTRAAATAIQAPKRRVTRSRRARATRKHAHWRGRR
jgi:cell division protein FtsQ